jgi:hypothetical protein
MTVHTHFKIVFRGVFTASPEQWSFSTKWERTVSQGPDAGLDAISQSAVTTAIKNYIGSFQFQNNVQVTEWRAYAIGTDNTMEGDPLLVDLTGNTSTGQGTARSYPMDDALCVTTVGDNRGHARYGRFYVPGPHAQLDADRRINVSWLAAFMTDTVAFLKAVSGAIDLPGTLASSDMLNISDDVSGTFQSVDHIMIGRVMDQISRRRNKLVEDHQVGGQIDW